MREAGLQVRPTKGPVQQIMQRQRRQPLLATDHVRHLHQTVVHDIRQVVRRQRIGRLIEHLVVERRSVHLDMPPDQVVHFDDLVFGHLEANDPLVAPRDAGCDLLFRERERRRQFLADRIVVCESFAARLVLLAQGVQLLGSIKSVVGPSGLHELFRVFQVQLPAPLALAVRRTGSPPTPTPASISMPHHLSDSRIYSSAPGTKRSRVGIFDTKNHRTAVPTREQVVIKRRTYAADMQRPRRAGCEAHPDRSFHISLLFVDFLFIVMFGFGRLATGRILRRRTPSGRFAQSRRHGPQRTHHPHYEGTRYHAPDRIVPQSDRSREAGRKISVPSIGR